MNSSLSLIMNARPCGSHDTAEVRPSSSTPLSILNTLVGNRSTRGRDFFFLHFLFSLLVEGISILAVVFVLEDEEDAGKVNGPRDEGTAVCCSMNAAMVLTIKLIQ